MTAVTRFDRLVAEATFSPPADADWLRLETAARLDQLADMTGDARYRRAAGHLKGAVGGRPETDAERLDDVRAVLAAEPNLSVRAACRRVASTMALAAHDVARHEERLRKQYRRKIGED